MSSNEAQYKMGALFCASLVHASQCQGLPSPFLIKGFSFTQQTVTCLGSALIHQHILPVKGAAVVWLQNLPA